MPTKSITIPEINIEGFQVVSADMFRPALRLFDPTMTLWYTSIGFSKATVTTLNNCERIRIEVNNLQKKILIVPVNSNDKDGIKWLKDAPEPSSRRIECASFTNQLFKLWDFDSKRAYRAIGKPVSVDRKLMILFDFSLPESWVYKEKYKHEASE